MIQVADFHQRRMRLAVGVQLFVGHPSNREDQAAEARLTFDLSFPATIDAAQVTYCKHLSREPDGIS
jgi:hypothetical protein